VEEEEEGERRRRQKTAVSIDMGGVDGEEGCW
jgi:hypothetical protein